MPGRKQDDSEIRPAKAGWYPDPWSADGRGERYFDGKKWGTSERPMARDATVTQISTRRRARARGRFRQWAPVLVFAALVLAVWGFGRLRHSGHHSSTAGTVPPVTTQLEARPPAGVGEAAAPLGHPAPVPSGNGKFTVMRHQPDRANVPVAFDPCRPVHYVVNPTGAPPDGARLVSSALARLHTATGLQFIDDGATTERPSNDREPYQPGRYPDRWAPVLIAWSNENEYPGLAGYVAGIGGPFEVSSDSGELVYVSGQVVLDSRQLAPARVRNRAEVRAVLLHELGHLVGLDHTADQRQIMYSESQFNVNDYAQGDLSGLALLGTQACFPDV